jgi:GAF domain-containing protein
MPTLIEDIANDRRLDENTRSLYGDRFGAKSTLFIPLVAGGQWIGYLHAMYLQPTSFPETEIRRLMGVAGQAAVTIQTIRLLEESNRLLESEQQQRQIADTLVRSAGRVSETLSEAELRQIVVDEIIDILRPDQVNLYEWVETEDAFRLELRQLADPNYAEDPYEVGQSIAFIDRPDLCQVLRENQSLLESALGEGAYLREHYCLPWLVGVKPMGVIEVFHTASHLTIRPEDQVRCEGVVRQAAIAIQNARSFEQTRRRAEREQMVNTIMQKIQSTVTVESALQTTIRELGQALQARYTLVEVTAGKEDSSNKMPVERN